jgi:hypothetical protein
MPKELVMSDETPNPLAPLDTAAEQRIRERAYHLWEADGRPHGRDTEYWERAEELTRMEAHPHAADLPYPTPASEGPVVEEASIQENLGEFPDRFADQGERMATPTPRKRKQTPV